MRNYLLLIASSILVFSVTSSATVDPNAFKLSGTVRSFDDSKLVIESGDQRVEVPRKLYVGKVKVGEKVQIPIPEATLNGLKKEPIAKK